MAIDADELRRVMSALGRKGGKVRSQAKTEAARRNARLPRRRLCRQCQTELTQTDKQAGHCTQCQQPIGG
jgi:ribosomal protein S30